ncbi:hypothetical protein [Kitasatospora sp. NPDC058046]|uniref:hypothetical protein n=1 Tax=Kitasatospora sp. NPDC058046 TaxID=3346312 RepID=UPI0036DDD515
MKIRTAAAAALLALAGAVAVGAGSVSANTVADSGWNAPPPVGPTADPTPFPTVEATVADSGWN